MWIGGDGIMFALMMLVFLMWSTGRPGGHQRPQLVRAGPAGEPGHSRRLAAAGRAGAAAAGAAPGRAADSRSTIDDDEHLAAYNAYLARLHQPPRPARAEPSATLMVRGRKADKPAADRGGHEVPIEARAERAARGPVPEKNFLCGCEPEPVAVRS